MSKLTPKYEFKKDGSKNIRGYLISLTKSECERNGFNCETEIEIEYLKDKIILKKRG